MAFPISATDIQIFNNVPFEKDQKHVRHFTSRSEQNSYFEGRSKIHESTDANLTHFEQVNKQSYTYQTSTSINTLYSANYMRFRNRDQGNRWFYAFVDRIEAVNARVSRIHFIPDYWQTFALDTTLNPSFIIREHQQMWNSNGMPLLNTIDEGLDYGAMYDTVSIQEIMPYENIHFLVIASKEKAHIVGDETDKITPSYNGAPQALCYYVVPISLIGSDITVNGEPMVNPLVFMKAMFESEDAVNNVVTMYITDYTGLNFQLQGNNQLRLSGQFEFVTFTGQGPGARACIYLNSIPRYTNETIDLGSKYSGFTIPDESKLLMYPYTVITLEDFKGNHVDYRPEYIEGNQLRLFVQGSMGASNKVSYHLLNYNNENLDAGIMKNKTGINDGIVNQTPQDLPILSDYLSAYLQGNRNSIANQQDSILFNGMINTLGAGLGMVSGGLNGAMQAGLGGVSSVGNTVLQLQQIEAKKQDIGNIPPTLDKQGGNAYFEFGNRYVGCYLIKKQIKPEYRRRLNDFFKAYGYASGQVKIPNLRSRQNWNYIEMRDANINGSCGTEALASIQQMYDNGVTLWHTNDMRNYNLANGVR